MAEIRNIGKINYEVERLVDDIKFSDEGMACENLNASLFISFIDIAELRKKQNLTLLKPRKHSKCFLSISCLWQIY